MDLNLLVAFDALYRERNVTRAGKRLGLSQPATSAALAKLRAMFDDALFTRTPHGLEPTAKCVALAEPVSRALADLRDAIEPVTFDPKTSEAVFKVGAVDAVIAVALRKVTSRVLAEAPRVRLEISACDPSNVIAKLDARAIDIALAPIHPVPAHVMSTKLFPLDLVVLVRKGHPLDRPKKGHFSLDDLLAHPHVRVHFQGPLPTAIDDALAKLGKQRHVGVVLDSFLAVPPVLAESDAIAIVPGPFGRRISEDGGFVSLPLPRELPQPPDVWMRLLWPEHADRADASRWLRETIAAAAARS